jgi:phosphoserine aminotransferase
MSVVEVGHRTEPFTQLMHEAQHELRALLTIPDHYEVLFLPFPARTQFAMVPLNLLSKPSSQGAYLVTGTWSAMAYREALHLKSAYCLVSSESSGYNEPCAFPASVLQEQSAYVYFTPNETIQGVMTPAPPAELIHGLPLVADMTSCLLSEPLNITDYGLIFAGAQKNIAPAGLTVVIIRKDLIVGTLPGIPTMLNYSTHAEAHSLYATPAQFQCYLALKMFHWVKEQGGVSAMARNNQKKAEKLYAFIDQSRAYETRVHPTLRSTMNVCFFMQDSETEAEFLRAAIAHGLYGLKGHKQVGGLRASLYNAMPMAGVDALIAFMQEFEQSSVGRAHG